MSMQTFWVCPRMRGSVFVYMSTPMPLGSALPLNKQCSGRILTREDWIRGSALFGLRRYFLPFGAISSFGFSSLLMVPCRTGRGAAADPGAPLPFSPALRAPGALGPFQS